MFSAGDFRTAFLQLMPQGPAWSRAPDGLTSLLAEALAKAFARNTRRAENLLVDAYPATAQELLQEWELSLGLPDPCSGAGATAEQRRSQVVARLTDNGGSSIEYFINFALNLGYTISTREYAPSRCGLISCGSSIQGEDWANCWLVLHSGYTPIQLRSGISTSGEALLTWSNGPLVCEISARNPAHLIVRFGQNGQNLLTDWGGDII